ncbi:IclR family transcriptional regulator [Marinibaculum pumilum]|uniref:IclR family transcriptional regulator n=1 Tax=Marinibaculum pumilum TaxID=1766165 RepID=A0ABV7L0N0_9PROT
MAGTAKEGSSRDAASRERDFGLDPNQSLSKALGIIQALGATGGDMGVRELGRELGMAPSIVHRLLTTLRNHGFVEQDLRTMRYRIGFGLFEAGQGYLAQRTLADSAFEELQQVSRDYEMAAYLGVIHDDQFVYILSIPGRNIATYTPPGKRAHLHSTALGKAALSCYSDEELAPLLDNLPMPRLTRATNTERARLAEEVRIARSEGWATCLEENIDDIFAIGVPVRDRRGEVIAAISLACHGAAEFTGVRHRALDDLGRVSARISARLGAVSAPALQGAV